MLRRNHVQLHLVYIDRLFKSKLQKLRIRKGYYSRSVLEDEETNKDKNGTVKDVFIIKVKVGQSPIL